MKGSLIWDPHVTISAESLSEGCDFYERDIYWRNSELGIGNKGLVDNIRVILNNDDDSAKRRSSSDAVGRVEKSTDFFHAFHSSSSPSCGKGGKVYGPFPRFPQ